MVGEKTALEGISIKELELRRACTPHGGVLDHKLVRPPSQIVPLHRSLDSILTFYRIRKIHKSILELEALLLHLIISTAAAFSGGLQDTQVDLCYPRQSQRWDVTGGLELSFSSSDSVEYLDKVRVRSIRTAISSDYCI